MAMATVMAMVMETTMARPKIGPRIEKILLIFLLIILVIITIVTTAFAVYWNKLDLLQHEEAMKDIADPISLSKDVESKTLQQEQQGSDEPEQLLSDETVAQYQTVKQEVVAPKSELKEDSGVLNVLIIGTDESTERFTNNANSDCMIILSIDKAKDTIKLVSIERGTGVPISVGQYAGEYEWINNMVRVGGPGFLQRTVSEVFRIDLMGYIRVNPYTFIKIVESCGGIDVVLTQEEADYINKALKDDSKLTKGKNHLDGKTAERYARLRAIDDDWSRIGRQRTVIQAAITQAKDMPILEINAMLDIVLPYVQTNLTKSQITELVFQVPSIAGKTAQQKTIPVEGTYSIMQNRYGKNMFSVDFETNAKELQRFLYN